MTENGPNQQSFWQYNCSAQQHVAKARTVLSGK